MRLDKSRILALFAMLTDLPDQELSSWEALCEGAGDWIMDHLRENVNLRREMERLCMAAAAYAYHDYAMLTGGLDDSDSEIRVGDISLKSAKESANLSVRDYFLSSVSDLVYLPLGCGFAFRSVGEEL